MKNIKELQQQAKELLFPSNSKRTQGDELRELQEDIQLSCYSYMCGGILIGVLVSIVFSVLMSL